MKTLSFEVKNLPEAWFVAIRELMERDPQKENSGTHQYKIDAGSFAGQHRREFDYITMFIEYPGTLPRIPDVPPGIPLPCNDTYVEEYVNKLMTPYKDKNEQYTYGEFLTPQIDKVIEKYKSGPGNNQCYMVIGNEESINLSDPPCLRGIDTRILNGMLHFVVYFRSWDLWAGFPNNLAAIQILKEYMASSLNVQDGTLIVASKGLHLYEYSWELAKSIIDR
jgi:thymidylate synthase